MATEAHEIDVHDEPEIAVTQSAPELVATKPIEEWAKLKGKTYPADLKAGRNAPLVVPHWLHDAARVLRGWAAVGQNVTEAEYDAAIAAAGAVHQK